MNVLVKKTKETFNISIDESFDLDEDDILSELNSESMKEDDDELDLEPVKQFMEDYIGQIIVDVSGNRDYSDIKEKANATIIMGVDLDGENIKFRLSKINGSKGGYLIISPTKYGMFTEKLSDDNLDLNSVCRISFYGGYVLEYLDSQGMGVVLHQE